MIEVEGGSRAAAMKGLMIYAFGLKSALSDSRPERADFRPDRVDFRPERA